MTGWYVLVAGSGILNGVFSYMIASYLSKHGTKINYWNIRRYMLKYLRQYRQLTIEENGRPGNLYYAWVVTLGLFLVSAVPVIVLAVDGK